MLILGCQARPATVPIYGQVCLSAGLATRGMLSCMSPISATQQVLLEPVLLAVIEAVGQQATAKAQSWLTVQGTASRVDIIQLKQLSSLKYGCS